MKRVLTVILPVLAIVLAAVLAFFNSFDGGFVFDDVWAIRDNPTLRSLWPLTDVLKPIPGALTVSGRPILNLSFALNFAIGGTDPWSYHAVNLVIHVLAGLLIFGIVRRALASPRLQASTGDAATHLATLIAVLWVVHPLQTESVTYIVQRAESLMGLLFLATLYFVIRGTASKRPWAWYVPAIAVCALGMGTKEVMALVPFMVFFYDRTFIAGSFAEAWRQRKWMYAGLIATLSIFIALAIFIGDHDGMTGFNIAVPWWEHALMQPQVIVRYIGLTFWPHPLVFDYGTFTAQGVMDVLPYALIILAALVAAFIGFIRNAAWSYAAVWFFAILAPTSSIVPSARQTMSEHRMYLPLAAVLALTVIGLYFLFRKQKWPTIAVATAAAIALCMVTINRNPDYESDFTLYSGAAAIQPNNAYAQFGYGTSLLAKGRTQEALEHIDIALRLKPGEKNFHMNRAEALLQLDRIPEALSEFETAFRLGTVEVDILLKYANALATTDRKAEAIMQLQTYLQLRPQNLQARLTLADTLLAVGRTNEAIAVYESVLQADPQNMQAEKALQEAMSLSGKE